MSVVGSCEVRRVDDHSGELSWTLYAGHRGHGYATRAVRMLADWATTPAGAGRVGAEPGRGEGRARQRGLAAGRDAFRPAPRGCTPRGRRHRGPRRDDRSTSSSPGWPTTPRSRSPTGFRALLNSFLPRKRAISQMLIRDPDEPGAALPAHLQAGLGPARRRRRGRRVAAARRRPARSRRSSASSSRAGDLLLTDWLPPWGGWDDALCLVFDGGRPRPGRSPTGS